MKKKSKQQNEKNKNLKSLPRILLIAIYYSSALLNIIAESVNISIDQYHIQMSSYIYVWTMHTPLIERKYTRTLKISIEMCTAAFIKSHK